jgi:hypothetical protein
VNVPRGRRLLAYLALSVFATIVTVTLASKWGAGGFLLALAIILVAGLGEGLMTASYRTRLVPDLPPAPVNVRLVIEGQTIPLELAYKGVIDGMYRWEATTDVCVDFNRPWEVTADAIPAHTSIALVRINQPPS